MSNSTSHNVGFLIFTCVKILIKNVLTLKTVISCRYCFQIYRAPSAVLERQSAILFLTEMRLISSAQSCILISYTGPFLGGGICVYMYALASQLTKYKKKRTSDCFTINLGKPKQPTSSFYQKRLRDL